MNIDEIARELSHEAYDRFVMGGWEAEDFVETAKQALQQVADDARDEEVRQLREDAIDHANEMIPNWITRKRMIDALKTLSLPSERGEK